MGKKKGASGIDVPAFFGLEEWRRSVWLGDMKSCLGLLLVLMSFVLVVGGGGLLWYLSETSDFSRKLPANPTVAAPPKAIPVMPKTPPPVAIPVREPSRR